MSNTTLLPLLLKAREELLDLTARNRLLNMPNRAAQWGLKIVNTAAEEVFANLVERGKRLKFIPLLDEGDGDRKSEHAEEVELPETGLTFAAISEDLPVKLDPDKLDKKLLKLQYDARTFEEEQGVNILYLAIGSLKWFEAEHSDRPRYAPLILLPVTLDRNNIRSKFGLTWTEEDIATNLTLKVKLKHEFDLTLPEIEENEDLDVRDYLNRVQLMIEDKPGWEVRSDDILLWFFSFSKFLMYRDLHPENWPEGKGLDEHDLIQSMFSDGFRNEPPICGDNDPIDDIIAPMDMVHVMDADSSQSVVVEEVKRGRNLVVQGPPGTGKSQTITNIIASAVTVGKKVLFVSEKMAALEVVKSRFEKVGLGELCLELHSHKTNKKVVLEDLSKTLDLGPPKHANFQQQAQELKVVRDRLNRHVKLLHQKLEPAGLSAFELIGHLTRMHSQGVPPSELVGLDAADWSASQYQEIHNQLDDMVLHLRKIGTPSEHIWRGVHLENPPLPTDLQRYQSRFNEVIDSLNPLMDAIEVLRNALSIDKPPSFSNTEKMRRAAQHLTNAPQMDLKAITSVIWEDRQEEITKVVNLGQSTFELKMELEPQFADVAWDTDVTGVRREIAAHGRSWFRIFKSGYRQAIATYRGIVADTVPATHDDRLEPLDKLIKAQKQLKQLKEDQRIQKIGESAFGENWLGIDSDWELLSSILKWVADGQEIKSGMNLRLLLSDLQQQELEGDILRQINTHLKPVYLQVDQLLKSFKLNLEEAFGVNDLRRVPLHVLQSRISAWRDNPEELSKWVQYDIRLSRLQNEGLTEVAEAIANGTVDAEDLVDRFEISYYEVLMRSAQKQFPDLAQFDGTAHEGLLSRFKELDQERIRLARLEVATAHFDRLPQNSGDIGEVGVIRREIAKKRKHLPIRRLLREAGRAIQSIKPVFMMSPISVAQFLEPGILDFELLVIDEASQVKPVDALGAIARCHQIVVVGDDKQLPPTGFFDKVLAGEDEEEDESFSAGDVESILGLCSAQSMPTRMLEWHYRSRHHSLITVSNHEFYNNRLYIVPHPSVSGSEGLVFRYIQNGVYDRGGKRTNTVEAQEVAKAVMQHAATTPNLSLGVGAFSVAQRDAVLAELERLRKDDPTHEEFFAAGVNEPFFVKNLENIQGDERDVIFISVGYGKDSSGYMTMGFGPLSADGGERRLNVLITRARERCEVFSSITADDIDLNRTKSFGTKSFKAFLSFAQNGHLDVGMKTGRDFDSEFEEEVARALENLGYEVHSQVGVAGFRVDLAIVDPTKPGRYLLGIECDGAAYHSSRSARDRDRIRQAVLEDRGWIIHRIWSTDWFRRPQEQVAKTVEAIEKAKLAWGRRADSNNDISVEANPDNAPQQIERSESNPDERNGDYSDLAIPYEEADFAIDSVIDWIGEDIHEIDPTKLAKIFLRVVELEGPVHREEIARRIATLWGLKRTGTRIVDAVSGAEHICVRQGVVDLRGQFLDISSRNTPRVRNRESVNSSNLRKPEFLPPSEIQAAILELVRSHYGIMKDEAVTATARLFGFRTTSQQLRETIEKNIESLISDNLLSVNDDKLTSC